MKSNLFGHWRSSIMHHSKKNLRVHSSGGCWGTPISLPSIWSRPALRWTSLTKPVATVLVPKSVQAQNLACLSSDLRSSSLLSWPNISKDMEPGLLSHLVLAAFILSPSLLEDFINPRHKRGIVPNKLNWFFVTNDLDGLGHLVDGEHHMRLSLLT